jgi:Rrf2 family protein
MAVHVLAVLAYKNNARVTSALLASSVNTNPVVIRRLLLALKKGKLIETRKGAGSGSRLSRSPARINLGQVYRVIEDHESFAMPRRKPNGACPVGHCIAQALGNVFDSAQAAIEQELGRTTLADIIKAVNGSCEHR